MMLLKALVLLFVILSAVWLLRSALEWAFYKDRAGRSLTAASGLLFVFWGSILAFLASR
jgi:hypothetical protein